MKDPPETTQTIRLRDSQVTQIESQSNVRSQLKQLNFRLIEEVYLKILDKNFSPRQPKV